MSATKLHIVAFDIPYPPDYGGAIDIYYKIKSLVQAGAEIYLHCFEYGRKHSDELTGLCKQVWYYPRKTGLRGLSFNLPYIVYSRRNDALLKHLREVEAPILFEGVHTTYYLSHPSLAGRIKAIRTHNIEHEYYRHLYRKADNLVKKYYYLFESTLLRGYELNLGAANAFFTLSFTDEEYFGKHYPNAKHAFIAPFHPYNEINSKTGIGGYALYHGNLSHPENVEAALYLLKYVFPNVNFPVIIAGKDPSPAIVKACNGISNCQLIADPSQAQMAALIQDAHIHALPTFQPTGMKLKLLYALFSGRHVIVNAPMIHGTGLAGCCNIAITPEDFYNKINEVASIPFAEADIAKRSAVLLPQYDNMANANKLLTYLLG